MEIQCLECNKKTKVRKSEVRRGYGKFCSMSCSSTYGNRKRRKPKEDNAKCAICNISFYRRPSSLKKSKSGLHFCCRDCKDKAQRIGGLVEIQPSHYNSEFSYRARFKREKGIDSCNRCGYNEYPQVLEIHHKDRDRENNEMDNLEALCPTCHNVEHRGLNLPS